MGASRKWIKSLVGGHSPRKVSPESKYKDVSRSRGKGWGLWKPSKKSLAKMGRQGEEEEGEKCCDPPLDAAVAMAASDSASSEAAVAAETATAPAGVVCVRDGESLHNRDKDEEWAAIMIQTAFRCLMARRALHALKGCVRLQALVKGHAARKQTAAALKCMQTMVKIQTRVRANQIRTLHLLKLKEKEEHLNPNSEGGWCDGVGSIQDIQDKARHKQEAALRRERALAYAYSNQKRAGSKQQREGEKQQEWGWIWLQNCVTNNLQTSFIPSAKDISPLGSKKSADHRPTSINNNHDSPLSVIKRASSSPKQRPRAAPLVDALPFKKRLSLPDDSRPLVTSATAQNLKMFPKSTPTTAVSA